MSSKKQQNLTCGSCSGLHRDRLVAGNSTPCLGQGKIPSAKACVSFKPDAFSLARVNDQATEHQDPLDMLSSCIQEFTTSELQVLASLFLAEKKTRKAGYRFWQKVYVRIRGSSSDNYMSNFVVGRILDADRDYIRVISDSGKSCLQLVNDKNSATLFTIDRFKYLRQHMVKNNLLIDPSIDRIAKKAAQAYIAPVDFAIQEGLVDDDFSKKNRKVRKAERTDLVTLVQKMSSGKILRRKEKQYNFDDDISVNHF